MDRDQLARWKALAEKATKGPWAWTDTEPSQWGKEIGVIRSGAGLIVAGQVTLEPADGQFIAASREAIPALIAHIEHLEQGT